MTTKPKIGLLPLYIELYDKALPGAGPRIEAFYTTIAEELGDDETALGVVPGSGGCNGV
jgi:hypothetical protein